MNREEIFRIIKNNPVCHLATVEGDKPHTRAIFTYSADETGIVFHTGTGKDVHKQLQANPNVELCFNDFQNSIQVRVSGKATLDEDLAFKKRIVETPGREFLKPWVETRGYEVMAVYRVTHCVAHTWTMESNFDEKRYVDLSG
ncbi:MAG: pyridoxamine 5'-phosphate oxidase family protein [Pseudomonadota bacterium]